LTLLLMAPPRVSEARLRNREMEAGLGPDRFEEAGTAFFARVGQGYESLAASAPDRVRRIDASASPGVVRAAVWREMRRLLDRAPFSGR
jgi:dTMP kinase